MKRPATPVGASLTAAPASTLPVSRPERHAPVGGQRRDQLADAGQHLDVALGDLVAQQLDVAPQAVVDTLLGTVAAGTPHRAARSRTIAGSVRPWNV